MEQGESKANVVKGNVLRLCVELTLRTLESVGANVESSEVAFVPKSGSVVARLADGARVVTMQVEGVEENRVTLADYGTLLPGEYSLEILCRDDQDNPYRYMKRCAVEVHDATACAGIEAGVEFDTQVQYLGATFTQVIDGSGGTVVQVQADWEQTDDTQPDYIKNKPEIPVAPTKVSELENDAGYLTEHQDISGKQDKIDDLATIRSGAAAGATAYQKPSGGIPATDIASGVIPDTSGFVTTSAMNTALAAKQDTLTFDNEPTENSARPVSSSGIYKATQSKANKADVQKALKLPIVRRAIPEYPKDGARYYFEEEVLLKCTKLETYQAIYDAASAVGLLLKTSFGLKSLEALGRDYGAFSGHSLGFPAVVRVGWARKVMFHLSTGNNPLGKPFLISSGTKHTLDYDAIFEWIAHERTVDRKTPLYLTSETTSPNFRIEMGQIICVAECTTDYVRRVVARCEYSDSDSVVCDEVPARINCSFDSTLTSLYGQSYKSNVFRMWIDGHTSISMGQPYIFSEEGENGDLQHGMTLTNYPYLDDTAPCFIAWPKRKLYHDQGREENLWEFQVIGFAFDTSGPFSLKKRRFALSSIKYMFTTKHNTFDADVLKYMFNLDKRVVFKKREKHGSSYRVPVNRRMRIAAGRCGLRNKRDRVQAYRVVRKKHVSTKSIWVLLYHSDIPYSNHTTLIGVKDG